MTMDVWIFSHYASVPAIGLYTGHFDLARGLVERGHSVTIFASSFSHYCFRETVLEANEKSREEVHQGIRFVWLRTPPYRANDWRRIRNMAVYGYRSLLAGLARRGRPDVCLGVSVHPLAGLSAYLVSRWKRARFVYEIRDLWPLVLIEMGRLRRKSTTARILRRLESFLVRKAARIIGAWKSFDRYIEGIGGDPAKVVWIPQFVDLNRIPSEVPPEPDSGIFRVMYTGGHVKNNGLDVVIHAASIIQERGFDRVQFTFIGSGQEKPELMRLSKDLNLRNVEFREPVPKEKLYEVMAEANVFITSLRSLPVHRYGICTNKLCDYLAMRRPIIYATLSTYNPVEEARAGITTVPESPSGIADAVIELLSKTPEERKEMGERAYRFMLQNHEKGVMVSRLEEALKAACAG